MELKIHLVSGTEYQLGYVPEEAVDEIISWYRSTEGKDVREIRLPHADYYISRKQVASMVKKVDAVPLPVPDGPQPRYEKPTFRRIE